MAQDCVSVIRRAGYEMKMKEIETRMANSTDKAEQMGLLAEYQALSRHVHGLP
jgi:hypothetical protein